MLNARLFGATTLTSSMAFSVVLHAFALFGIEFVLPGSNKASDMMQPLQVVLVNSKSDPIPLKADALAQANLDGGGNTADDRRAKSPLPAIRDDKRFTPEQSTRRVAKLEEETRRIMSRLKSDYKLTQPEPKNEPSSDASNGEDLVQKSLEIARLESQISKNWDEYQKMPRRKFIGARTQEYRYAQYIEDWRIKVERIGNLNYPAEARRQQVYGSLKVSVSIHADGSLENVEVSRSSGHRILDAAAIHIVKLAAPYAPLPPDIAKDVDILTIVRTWTFTSSDKLESE
ncbi:MAG: energy transducer TonB [Nitrosomonadales bacterium]|nr:energy transducer TonB [Nitrosomonadales bacterium]